MPPEPFDSVSPRSGQNPEPGRRVEFIDTHCHLDYDPLAASVEAVLARAQRVGVRHCLTIGTTVEASRANIALAHRYPQLRAAIGVHPHEAKTVTERDLATIEELALDPAVAAIGEIGLDDYYQHSPREEQQRVFKAFLQIARRRHLPIAIHCRDAYDALLSMIRSVAGTLRGVIHCASGPPEFIRGALERGFYVSFAGTVTFRNAQAVKALVSLVPDDRLLIETDAPFLAPEPLRGKKNEPANIAYTAAVLAQLRGITVEQLGAITSRNARSLFGFPPVR